MTRPRGPHGFLTQETQKVKGSRKTVIKRLWAYVAKYRLRLIIGMLLSVLSAASGLVGPYLIGLGIDKHIAQKNMQGLTILVLVGIGVCIIMSLATYLQHRIMIYISQKTVRDLREDLFVHTQKLPLIFFDKTPHGELMSRMTNDTDTISAVMADSLMQLVTSICSIIGAAIIMFRLCVPLAFVCFITVPFLILTTRFIATRSRKNFKKRQASLGMLNASIQESINCSRAVISLDIHDEMTKRFERENNELASHAINALITVGTMGPCMNMFRNLSFAIVAGSGAYMAATNIATVGSVAAILNYSEHFNRPINQIANIYGSIQSALAGAARVFEILDAPTETENDTDNIPISRVKGNIVFDDVTFGYNETTDILKNVTFTAPAGTRTALVGTTGAGKTTIINLLSRFYNIKSGKITIDGIDISKIERTSLRRNIGTVLQDTHLFTGTVKDNIRYGRLDATTQEIKDAAKLANADSFITSLPHGYDTVLADSGANLSHGQRQLLAIARTILADPAILILDEATSSVDTRTEKYIQDAMKTLMKGKTTFIIAHRLNTIRETDCIMVIENGKICEKGTHAQLIAANGVYSRLYNS